MHFDGAALLVFAATVLYYAGRTTALLDELKGRVKKLEHKVFGIAAD